MFANEEREREIKVNIPSADACVLFDSPDFFTLGTRLRISKFV